MEKREPSYTVTLLVECKLVQLLWKTVWRFLKKLEIELPYDPAIPLLGIHTEEIRIERDTCTPMFIAALFTIARTWKQPRCPSTDEQIKKLWYIHVMKYYSDIKSNTFVSVLMKWIPGLGRSAGEVKGYPLQYYGLENSMDYIVLGVAKSRT